MCLVIFYIIREVLCFGLSNITLFRVSLGLLSISINGRRWRDGGCKYIGGCARALARASVCVFACVAGEGFFHDFE